MIGSIFVFSDREMNGDSRLFSSENRATYDENRLCDQMYTISKLVLR